MKTKNLRLLILLNLMIAGLAASPAFAENKEFTFATLELNGTKIWLPSIIVVHKGDKVTLHAVSKTLGAPNVHGFQIQDMGVTELIDRQGKDISFVADKPGIHNIKCHLHPQHIGAQILVLE